MPWLRRMRIVRLGGPKVRKARKNAADAHEGGDVFIVALYLPWCRYLWAGVQPQLQADNPKCVSGDSGVLLRAARFTTGYVRLVGQEPAPSKCVLMSTSGAVRSDVRGWIVTRWSVKLDVRDLGGHFGTTFRGWSATLAARVRLVIARLTLIFVLPLDFHGGLRVIRTMFVLGALHGFEASFFADSSLRKLHTAIFRAVWSSRQPLANTGAVLSLLDCPSLVDIRENPEFHGLVEVDKSRWPRCLLWHGWLLLLSRVDGGSPWAEDPPDGAGNLLECALGPYASDLLRDWRLPVGFDAEGSAESVAVEPDVWTDGSLVEDKVSGASSSGSGFFTHHPGQLWAHRQIVGGPSG